MKQVNVAFEDEMYEGMKRLAADRDLTVVDLLRSTMSGILPEPQNVTISGCDEQGLVKEKTNAVAYVSAVKTPISRFVFGHLMAESKEWIKIVGDFRLLGSKHNIILTLESGKTYGIKQTGIQSGGPNTTLITFVAYTN